MPLRLFRSRNVTGSNLVMAMIVVGMFGLFFLGALYLQRILGYEPLEVGLAFLPSTVVMGIVSLRASQPLIMRHGPQKVLVPALLTTIAGLLLFARTPVDGNFVVDILPGDDPDRPRRRPLDPGRDRAGDVRRHARGLRPGVAVWSTRPCRSAARSAWPCWRRWPASTPAARPTPPRSTAATTWRT